MTKKDITDTEIIDARQVVRKYKHESPIPPEMNIQDQRKFLKSIYGHSIRGRNIDRMGREKVYLITRINYWHISY